ncbi:ABC transporter permease [Thiomicrorhabdus sp.]|uniref:ABC transporter permease n=1 Tax=Thiomicrorhabdus sp. TaxID=2039724 RepID=UPI0029C8411F|nr:ABC transporter permease [Thiomicrorhabdus sp.]
MADFCSKGRENSGRTDSAEFNRLLGNFFAHRMAQAGLWGMGGVVLLVVCGSILLPYEVGESNLAAIFSAPSWNHLIGTDELGRDLLARLITGVQVSLGIALAATFFATLLGCFYGLLAGMGPGWLDKLMMQFLDAVLSIPVLLLVIVSQAFGESSLLKMIAVIGLASWMGTARIMRTECRRLMQADFIAAAVIGGSSKWRLAFRHILPNAAAPLLVVVTVSVGQAVLIESTLSFLNLGVPSTLPSLGNLLGNGMSSILSGAWWVVLFPGAMIVLITTSINLMGDGLRDTVDPKRRNG